MNPPLRRAEKADARVLARLIDIAGEGIPSFLWAQAAKSGETPLQVGARRAGREEGSFSYRNAYVIEAKGDRGPHVAGMLLGYRQPNPYPEVDLAQVPGVVRPLIELESLAPGSWFANALAVLPEDRGRNFGSRLLVLARALAEESGARQISLIVAEENARAVQLYARCGYRTIARRPVVSYPGAAHGGAWLLMVQDIA
ncbi:MAG: GNAT family N-acetyltransferase [Alphaproteobacteria bacterium]|nr:GNAT family N-acetyltransferase [Alphaproteobacteria bacterium]